MRNLLVLLSFLLVFWSYTQSDTLTAIKVDEATLDSEAEFWEDASELMVATEGSREDDPDGPAIQLKAAYDDESMVIRAEWLDDTESVLKNAWIYEDGAFKKSGDEDRIMFAFPIENNAEFANKGCTAACHNSADDEAEWWMGSEDEYLRYDAWQWKAARTNPVGQVDDKWWGTQEDPEDVESSRHGDAKESGGYSNNRNEEQTGPSFMHISDLGSPYIIGGEEVALDINMLEEGMVVPGYLVSPAIGSRGDVATEGVWADGKWVVVIKRPLDTGNDDDVVFNPPRPVPFGVAVVDDGGGLEHTVSPEVLILDWQ